MRSKSKVGRPGVSAVRRFLSRVSLLVCLPLLTFSGGFVAAEVGTVAGSGLRIVRQPESFAAGSGGSLWLSVQAEGKGVLTYQWKRNGVPLAGAVRSFLYLTDLLEEDAGTYTVEVGDGEQGLSSAGASVSVLAGAPVVLGQTPSQSVTAGGRQVLRVFARDGASVSYQWRKGGVPVPGATGATYVVESVRSQDAGRYDVLLKNEFGTAQTPPILLAVVKEVGPDYRNPINRWINLREQVSAGQDFNEDPFPTVTQADIAVDQTGNVFFSDTDNHVVRKVSPAGVVSVVAGKAGESGAADGAGMVARFNAPEGIAVDAAGNLYVADTGNQAVRKVTPSGQVSTLATQTADAGGATGMLLPRRVAVDPSGTVYVLDNATVRKVQPDKSTAVVFGADPAAESGEQPYPTALAVDASGRLYVAAVDAAVSKLFVRGSGGSFSEVALGGASEFAGVSVLEDLAFGQGSRLYACSELEGSVFHLGGLGTPPASAIEPANLAGEGQVGTLPSALSVDAGGVVYLFDKASLSVLVGIPEAPPALSVQPAPVTCPVGDTFALRVEVDGGEEVFYQWFRGEAPVSGATGPVLNVANAAVADSGSYRVEVSTRAGRVVSLPATVLVAPPGPSLAVFLQPGSGGGTVRFMRGTAAGVKVALNPAGAEALGTEYAVHAYAGGAVGAPVGISGSVPATGEMMLPLRALSSGGSYVVRFTRRFSDQTLVVTSDPFQVELLGIESLAGSYEVLLREAPGGPIEDGAIHRGVLLVSVSKTGAVSGRLLYNEAPALKGAPDAGIRAYACVVRSFSASLTPSVEDPLKMVCSPKVGVGSTANRQKLQIEFNLARPLPELNATVTDIASVSTPGGSVSQGSGGMRCVARLSEVNTGTRTVNLSAAAGRYTLSADGGYIQLSPADNNLAQMFVQVLPTGRVLWASNLAGYAGTGSAGLAAGEEEKLVAQFYEGRTVPSTKVLATNSLLGALEFTNAATGWRAAFTEGVLERQTAYISRDASKEPFYDEEAFNTFSDSASNWSRVAPLSFLTGEGCRWEGATRDGLAGFFWAGFQPGAAFPVAPLEISVTDPLSEEIFTWKVTVSSAGVVRTAPASTNAAQPVLTLRLDRIRGLWSGSYSWSGVDPVLVPKGVRRNFFGAAVEAAANPELRARGWVEAGVMPSTKTASWELTE
jgi:sugar lactone lactonase YvrE